MDLPAALRFLRLAVPSRASVFVPPFKPDAGLRAWSIWVWLLPQRQIYRDGATGSPRFLENPDCAFALLLDPGETIAPTAPWVLGAAPAARTAEALASRTTFEAELHGFGTCCLRFTALSYPSTGKTRLRLPATLCRTGLITRRVP